MHAQADPLNTCNIVGSHSITKGRFTKLPCNIGASHGLFHQFSKKKTHTFLDLTENAE